MRLLILMLLGSGAMATLDESLDAHHILSSPTQQYVKCKLLGRGFNSIVYEAALVGPDALSDCSPGSRRVALKCTLINRPTSGSLSLIDQVAFTRTLTQRSWNLVGLDYIQVPRQFECGVFELGPSWLRDSVRVTPLRDRIRVARRVVRILADLHSIGFTHGDIHMGNFLLDRISGAVYLIDFERAAPATPEMIARP